MGMYVIPNKVDFYITNVCNLTCHNCNRFNNHDFKGWQRWSDYEAHYEQWGKLVELKAITIMGGEPFLNPTLADWVSGLNRIFGIEVQILTNGTRFLQNKNLYEKLLYRSSKNNARNHVGVSLHNMEHWNNMKESIYNFLDDGAQEYAKGHPKNRWNSDWHFIDRNGIQINVHVSNKFGNSAIQKDQYNRYRLYNNDPVEAHKECSFVKFKSYHYIRGRLYKCGPVALMPEFDQQNQFDLTNEERVILNSYRPLTVENFEQYHQEFFANLDNPIPQCRFCPTKWDGQLIYPVRKGL